MTIEETSSEHDECTDIPKDDYNLGLRIGSIFIIMAATLIGKYISSRYLKRAADKKVI